jgi:hypothetical protein
MEKTCILRISGNFNRKSSDLLSNGVVSFPANSVWSFSVLRVQEEMETCRIAIDKNQYQ